MLCIPSLSLQGDGSAASPTEVPDLSSPGSPLRVGGQPSPPGHCRPQQHSPSNLTVIPSYAWSTDTTSVCTNSNIQDGPDLQDQVVNTETPVVVDCHAPWCGPCKIQGPRLEKVVTKQQRKEGMAQVDTDDHTDLAVGQANTMGSVSCAHHAGQEEWGCGGQVRGHQMMRTSWRPS